MTWRINRGQPATAAKYDAARGKVFTLPGGIVASSAEKCLPRVEKGYMVGQFHTGNRAEWHLEALASISRCQVILLGSKLDRARVKRIHAAEWQGRISW